MKHSAAAKARPLVGESDSGWPFVLMGVVLGGAAAFDHWVELDVAAGVPYVALVCLAYFTANKRWI